MHRFVSVVLALIRDSYPPSLFRHVCIGYVYLVGLPMTVHVLMYVIIVRPTGEEDPSWSRMDHREGHRGHCPGHFLENHPDTNARKIFRARKPGWRGWVGWGVDMRTGRSVSQKPEWLRLTDEMRRTIYAGYGGGSME